MLAWNHIFSFYYLSQVYLEWLKLEENWHLENYKLIKSMNFLSTFFKRCNWEKLTWTRGQKNKTNIHTQFLVFNKSMQSPIKLFLRNFSFFAQIFIRNPTWRNLRSRTVFRKHFFIKKNLWMCINSTQADLLVKS